MLTAIDHYGSPEGPVSRIYSGDNNWQNIFFFIIVNSFILFCSDCESAARPPSGSLNRHKLCVCRLCNKRCISCSERNKTDGERQTRTTLAESFLIPLTMTNSSICLCVCLTLMALSAPFVTNSGSPCRKVAVATAVLWACLCCVTSWRRSRSQNAMWPWGLPDAMMGGPSARERERERERENIVRENEW